MKSANNVVSGRDRCESRLRAEEDLARRAEVCEEPHNGPLLVDRTNRSERANIAVRELLVRD